MKHPHAEFLLQLANTGNLDGVRCRPIPQRGVGHEAYAYLYSWAINNPKGWKVWRKLPTHFIRGREVPAPLSDAAGGDDVAFLLLGSVPAVSEVRFSAYNNDHRRLLSHGCVFASREAAQANFDAWTGEQKIS
jgi:hypothetical protein